MIFHPDKTCGNENEFVLYANTVGVCGRVSEKMLKMNTMLCVHVKNKRIIENQTKT